MRRISLRVGDDLAAGIDVFKERLGKNTTQVIELALTALFDRLPPGSLEPLASAPEPAWARELRQSHERVIASINRVGANVNQCVRVGHSRGWSSADIEAVIALHEPLEAVVTEAKEALSNVRH